MDTPIPSIWRIWFATLDPLIAFSGILAIINPVDYLPTYGPTPEVQIPLALETQFLLYPTIGFLLGIMFLQIVMLRLRSHDVTVWKCLQASIAIVDVAMIASLVHLLRLQGKGDPALWWPGECTSVVVTGVVLVSRVLFLVGVGLGSGAAVEPGLRPPLGTLSDTLKWD
jgi:hypothetical protein